MEYMLRKGEVVRFDASVGSQILQTLSGTIWLTGAADPADHLLTAGRRFHVKQGDSIVLEALEAASFSLGAAQASVPLRFVIRLDRAIPDRA